MYLEAQLRAICAKFFEDLNKTDAEQNQIYYTVLYFIHSAPHLSTLYLNWSMLGINEKFILNSQIKASLSKIGKIIYPPIIRAFQYWDMVQDTYGAPGFNCSPLKTELSEETDRNIVKAMMLMEMIISQINDKRKVMDELLSYKDPYKILCNYRWRIISRNVKKRRSYLRNVKERRNKEGDTSDEDIYESDLKQCDGDTAWYSDDQ